MSSLLFKMYSNLIHGIPCFSSDATGTRAKNLHRFETVQCRTVLYRDFHWHRGFYVGCFVCVRQSEAKVVWRYKRRVHVAAMAQLFWEERKRLERIQPKAYCPTCLCPRTLSTMCSFSLFPQY